VRSVAVTSRNEIMNHFLSRPFLRRRIL